MKHEPLSSIVQGGGKRRHFRSESDGIGDDVRESGQKANSATVDFNHYIHSRQPSLKAGHQHDANSYSFLRQE
jgi:hypothetical protein